MTINESSSVSPDRTDPAVSIVIPAYNEEKCIAGSLAEVMNFARTNGRVAEVIVIDDGSTDRTAAIVEANHPTSASSKPQLRLIRHERNQGKGAAVRNGVLAARGDIVLFTDADLSSPVDAIPQLIDPIAAGECDIVVASRALDRSLIDERQTRFRETAGKLFNVFVRSMTGLDVRDTQCGFKAFRRRAVLPIFEVQRLSRFAFDVEVLYLARKRGLTIREIPLPWSHVHHTKVSLLRDSVSMFVDVLRVRTNDLRGRYRFNGDVPDPRHDPA